MPVQLYTTAEALVMLNEAIAKAGSKAELARLAGCHRSEVTEAVMQRRRIYGALADYIGIHSVYAYMRTPEPKSTKQENYENKRLKYLEDNGINPYDGARSIGTPGRTGR